MDAFESRMEAQFQKFRSEMLLLDVRVLERHGDSAHWRDARPVRDISPLIDPAPRAGMHAPYSKARAKRSSKLQAWPYNTLLGRVNTSEHPPRVKAEAWDQETIF